MANLIAFSCPCGNTDTEKTRYYDGMMGYEAIICTCCGRTHDHEGIHEADEFSLSYVCLME